MQAWRSVLGKRVYSHYGWENQGESYYTRCAPTVSADI